MEENMVLANACNSYRQLIQLKDIVVDEYQREVDRASVEKIKKNFKPYYFDDIKVSKRENGKYACIDGNHHATVAKELFGEDEYVWCRVLEKLSPKEESEMFRELNSMQKRISSTDKLKAKAFEGSEEELSYFEALKTNGIPYSLTKTGSAGVLVCHTTAFSLFKKYGKEKFNRVVKMLSTVDNLIYKYNSGAIKCAFLMYETFGNDIVDYRLAKTIDALAYEGAFAKGTLSGLGGARNYATNPAITTCIKITDRYNKGAGKYAKKLKRDLLVALL